MPREALERAGQELWTNTELLPDFVGTDGNDVLTPKSAGVTWGMDGDDILVSEDNGHLNILIGGDGDDIYVIEPGSVSFIQAGDGHDKLDVSSFAGRDNSFMLIDRGYPYRTTRMSYSSSQYISFLYDPITKTTIGYNYAGSDSAGPNETFESIIYGNGSNSYSSYHQDWVFEWPTIPQLYLYRNTGIESLPAKAWGYLNELTSQEFYATGNPKFYVSTSNYFVNNNQNGLGRLVAEIDVVDGFYDQILNQLSPDLPDPQAFEVATTPTAKLIFNQDSIAIQPNSHVEIPIYYSLNYDDGKSTGISTNIFYDSSILTLAPNNKGFENLVDNSDLLDFYDWSIHDDTEENLDNDPKTDKFLNLSWVDITGEFPGTTNNQLGVLRFNTAPDMADPVTGELKTTNIKSIPAQAQVDYATAETSLALTATETPFSLDVDGDGKVSLYTDGIIIIRKMISYAFKGDKLTGGAISDNATRTTEEIDAFISNGIDSKALDVDKDGNVSLYNDGIMIIRSLIGLQGEALTKGTLASASPYTGDENAWQMVQQNIDLMTPKAPIE